LLTAAEYETTVEELKITFKDSIAQVGVVGAEAEEAEAGDTSSDDEGFVTRPPPPRREQQAPPPQLPSAPQQPDGEQKEGERENQPHYSIHTHYTHLSAPLHASSCCVFKHLT
jgi:hypothetical protein